ncbi:MOSC domain-containing protein [Comamonadaceae bacterium OH2545_COT-014]|nr:MOSC domain-containing protein [Comamonadaceae bacterium OH2545_COT-014]
MSAPSAPACLHPPPLLGDGGDVSARVASLHVYPVKSCAGVAPAQARLHATGLALDRAWVVTDAAGDFVTQRSLPRMALIQAEAEAGADGATPGALTLRAPGMAPLCVPPPVNDLAADAPVTRLVRVWQDRVPAWDMGEAAAQWLSRFLACPGLRLARVDPAVPRLASQRWTGEVAAPVHFADGFPLLIASAASLAELNERLAAAGHAPVDMRRFRPNIVLDGLAPQDEDRLAELRLATAEGGVLRIRPVKPCTRCPMPNVDPATGDTSPAVLEALRTFRANPRMDGAITFGMNAIVIEGAGQSLRVGADVAADWAFD